MNKDNIKNIPLFFILGRPRSGTTMLASLFDAHPNVVLPFECPLIINIFSKYYKTTNWTKSIITEFVNDVLNQRKVDSWRINKQELLNYMLDMQGKNSFETMIKALYLNFNSFFDKEQILLIGDKNPVYSIYPTQLVKLFPNAKFIHLTRDYRDNILSIQNVDFEAPITALLAYRWRFAEKRILKEISKSPSSFYTIKYEDFVSEPKKYLMEMCNFLQIDYKPETLEFYKNKEKIFENFDRKHIEKYHSSLLRPITADKIYGWKNKMNERDIKVADSVVGSIAEKCSYKRKYPYKGLPYLSTLFWVNYGRFAYALRFLTDKLPFKMKMRIRNKGPLLAVIFNKYFGNK